MNVLSLFDGISCGQIALERAGIPVTQYYASEIDKHAIKVTQHNYPNTIQLGSVTELKHIDWLNPKIDLLIGGSPCQGFSFAGKQLNFNDPRSALFFEYVRILKEIQRVNPDVKFLLENVVMKQEYQDVISSYLGVQPIMINSALVSAQNRKRLYWTNIEGITQPEGRGIYLEDVLENGVPLKEKSQTVLATIYKENAKSMIKRNKQGLLVKKLFNTNPSGNGMNGWVYGIIDKSPTLTTNKGEGIKISPREGYYRKLTPLECERLQTVPDQYTSSISNTQRYITLGNGWTVDVIAHIFQNLKSQTNPKHIAA